MTSPKHRSGLGMMDLLLIVVVLCISVLGAFALRMHALKMANDRFYRGQATEIALDMRDRYRLNDAAIGTSGARTAAAYYVFSHQWSNGVPVSLHGCESASVSVCDDGTGRRLAAYDINVEKGLVQSTLPQGQVAMMPCPGNVGTDCIFVSWAGTSAGGRDCVNSDGSYAVIAGTPPSCLKLEATDAG